MVGQLNLYAYCLNNPVMYTDETGCFVDVILDVLGLIWSIVDFIDTPSWENLGWLALDIVFMLVPVLTGSYALKATAKGTQYVGGFVDLGKTTVKATNYASDAAEVIAKADDKAELIEYLSKPTKYGDPSWTTIRKRFWQWEATHSSISYSHDNIGRMLKGLAPIGSDGLSMQLHHMKGRQGMNIYDFVIMTATDHKAWHKLYGYKGFY